MSNLTLIIITGLPCTGKTTLGRKISNGLKLPFVSKDDIREILFENFGWEDQSIQKKITQANHDLLYYFVELNFRANQSVIIDNAFKPERAEERINQLKKRYKFNIIQLRLFAKGETLYARFKERTNSKENEGRHPGHGDKERLAEWKSNLMKGKIEALDIGGVLLDIDTKDFTKIDYDEIYKTIKSKVSVLKP